MWAASYIGCITPPSNWCYKSQIESNCPTGYNKYYFMNCYVKDDRRDMWHKFQKWRSIQSKCYQDGLCKKEDVRLPNQVVCPLGKVLFPDLTFKDDYSECTLYLFFIAKVRCVDQTQGNNNFDCQVNISCSNPDDIVCPDGTRIENSIMYKPLKKCPDKFPYLYFGSSCRIDFRDFPTNIICGDFKSLCRIIFAENHVIILLFSYYMKKSKISKVKC